MEGIRGKKTGLKPLNLNKLNKIGLRGATGMS